MASAPKEFQLHRSPFYRDAAHPAVRITIMSDPGAASKFVLVSTKADLLQQMREFGEELGRACTVSQKHCARGIGFRDLPYAVRCCEDNTPTEEYGERLVIETLQQRRTAKAVA